MVFCLKLKSQIYHAGDITYTWLSGYTYKIKLTNFTTIGSASLYDPCEDTLCNGQVVLRSNGFSSGSCTPAMNGVPISSNIKLNEYETNYSYPGPGNYVLCVDDKNRNPNIINIPNSVNQSMALESFLVIPTFSTGKNSAPVFSNIPMASGCLNTGCFTYNPGAYDAEGDSLSYELLPCMSSSGSIPGYSYPNAGASGTFSIDPVTGTLSWCDPQSAGDYNVGILIKEWRKNANGTYFLVGYVLRDTQFNITNCTGINEMHEKENRISVFPNPVTENLTLTFNQNNDELFTIELFDVTGRKTKTFAEYENLSKQSSIQLQTEHIKPGVYFLKITGDKHTSLIKKIIKQ